MEESDSLPKPLCSAVKCASSEGIESAWLPGADGLRGGLDGRYGAGQERVGHVDQFLCRAYYARALVESIRTRGLKVGKGRNWQLSAPVASAPR